MPTYEDIAFKVIVKNDGISDVIFKTLMLKGEAGGTISSIEKTSSVGVVDTYTITLNDGTTTTFEVTNGSNIQSIEKTATSGLIDTYTVTLTNGDTTTFEVKNGEDAQLYELPQNCVVGYDKEPTQVTETSYERYISLDNVNGISSVKYNGNTLQETNDGRNLLKFSTIDQQIVNSDGITFTFDADTDLLTFSGTNTKTDNHYIFTNSNSYILVLEPNTTYTFSRTSNLSGCFIRIIYRDGNNTEQRITLSGDSTTFTTESQINNLVIYVGIYYNATTVNGSFKLQIEKGSTATPYQPYCGGIPSPNPSYPQEIVGVGDKQQDNTYSVDLVAEDADGNVYTVTASGLSYPVYQGDWIDLVAGKLYRYNGYKVLDGSENWVQSSYSIRYFTLFIDDMMSGNRLDGRCDHFRLTMEDFSVDVNNSIRFGWNNKYINICSDEFTDMSDFQTWLSNNNPVIVYPLATATEESITLTGDLEQVKRIRGKYAFIDAPLRTGSTEITFGQETDFPDGYEEIDFPLDDMFYYQDQEYIEFPTSWGFVMGYVFDASEIRFTMNVTKDLKEGFNVVANKSVDLALNLYTGSGGSNLTGFNFVEASFIREYGQIQIRLKTENPHGLTVGSLLGARVSQGRLRITFEEEEEE